jgi:capsular polysaccharide biosynthesis protein
MEEIDLRELFEYFKSKFIWIIIAVVVAVGIGNIFTILTRVPMYRSNTTIVLVSENKTESYNTTEYQLNKNLVGTYSEIVKSRKVVSKVIKNLNLDYEVAELQNNITVSEVDDTEIIKISVVDKNAEMAAQIADEVADVFMTEIQKIYKLNNVSVIDAAVETTEPYNVNYLKDNAIYTMIGLVLSCGLIFIFFYFDTTIKTSEEIENKLGLTVIGLIPKVEKE